LISGRRETGDELCHRSSFGDMKEYDCKAFAAEHGSSNRFHHAGYEVVRIPIYNGHADGSCENFLNDIAIKDGRAWGAP
jgi:glucose/arabinose dehydrogenase